jgi:hypothetical protein
MGKPSVCWQHEPCWYAVRKKGHWTGDRKQTTLWTIPSGGQDTDTVHGTQKPVEYIDVSVPRWQAFTGRKAILAGEQSNWLLCGY